MVPNGLDPGFDRAASRAQGFLKTARAKRSGRRPVHPTLIGQNPSNEVTRRFIALAPQFAGVTLGVIAQSVRSKTPHRREFLASCESLPLRQFNDSSVSLLLPGWNPENHDPDSIWIRSLLDSSLISQPASLPTATIHLTANPEPTCSASSGGLASAG